MWCYDWVVCRGCGVVEREWDGSCRSPAWGLNGGWMGVLGMIAWEWVGGCCCVGGWLVGMLLCGVDGGIVVCGGYWEG